MSSPAVNPPAPQGETAFQADWKSLSAMLTLQAQNVFNTKITQFTLIGLAGVIAGQMIKVNSAAEGTLMYGLLIELRAGHFRNFLGGLPAHRSPRRLDG